MGEEIFRNHQPSGLHQVQLHWWMVPRYATLVWNRAHFVDASIFCENSGFIFPLL
jgi:hypothetical protein